MIFAKCAAIFLLLVLCMAGAQACAQNQTPANVPAPPPPVDTADVWHDPATGLMWTKADNGSDINWNQANTYCSNLRLGGYSDWRLPIIDELQGIYDPSIDTPGHWTNGDAIYWHVKGNLRLSGTPWSSSLENAGVAWQFSLVSGRPVSFNFSDASSDRALCVRR